MPLPLLPSIGVTPYGTFGPTQLANLPGENAVTSITRGLDYRNPNNRMFEMTVDIDLFNLPTLPDRMTVHMQAALIFHLRDVCEAIIASAQQSLKPGHGYRTGLMHDTLIYKLQEHLLETGVYYDLLSEVALYWRYVEFGHWIAGTNRFWPGYHFLENSIRTHESTIRSSVREAWQDVVIKLAEEARASFRGRI